MRQLLFLLIFISSLWANTSNLIILDGEETHVKLTPHTSYFLDKTSQLNQYTIQSSDVNFTQSTKESISLGYQYTSNLWVTFSIKNNSDTAKDYLIENINTLNTFTIYSSNGKIIDSAGPYNLDKFNKNFGHIVNISLPANNTQTYYMKIENSVTSMKLNLDLWDKDTYLPHKNKYWNIVSLLSGAMFILALYNLMLFFFTKDRSYIYYVLLTLGLLYHEINITGYILFFPKFMIPNSSDFIHWMVLFTFIFIPIFTRSFLQLSVIMPRSNIYLKYLPFLMILVTIFTVYELIPIFINRILFIFFVTSSIFIGLIALFKGVKQARYYIFGWSIIFIAFVSLALHRIGILQFNPNEYHITQLAVLAEALIFSVGLAARIRYTKDLSNKDHLTGSFNRRYFYEVSESILAKNARKNKEIAVATLDADYFKKINDTHGHDIGDLAIKKIATVLNKNLRESDLMARFGGEEYCILLEDITLENTKLLFEKIRLAFENNKINTKDLTLKYTVSIGIAYGKSKDIDEMIKVSDDALYEAKHTGRNKVVMYNV